MREVLTLERGLSELDAVRRSAFLAALRSRVLAPLVVERDRRLVLFASLHATVALVLSIHYPVLTFVLAPVCLGVAHVAADVRYLVLRRGLEPVWRRVVVAACTVFVLAAVLTLFGWLPWSERAQFGLAATWAGAGVVLASRRSRAWKRAGIGLLLVVAVAGVAWRWPSAVRLAYLHAHNLVALAVWPLFFRRRLPLLSALRGPIVLAAGLLAGGVAAGATLHAPGVRQWGLTVLDLSVWLAPAVRVDTAVGITSAFIFLQAIHYSVWLSVIPQAAMAGQGTLSFRQSARALRADFGTAGTLAVVGGIAAVLLFATTNAPRASATYMSLALFHGYLELVLLLYFWVAREPLAGGPIAARGAR